MSSRAVRGAIGGTISGAVWLGVAALAAVDAAAGVLAAVVAGFARPESYPVAVFMACVTVGALSHAVGPGWVTVAGPMPRSVLRLRVVAARGGMATCAIWAFVALLALIGVVFVMPRLGLVGLGACPFVIAGAAGLGAAWAQDADPRTTDAAPPEGWAEWLAGGGAAAAWLGPAVVWWVLGWIPAYAIGPWAVASAAVPLNVALVRGLVGAGLLPPPAIMLRRAAAGCAVLLLLAGLAASAAGVLQHRAEAPRKELEIERVD